MVKKISSNHFIDTSQPDTNVIVTCHGLHIKGINCYVQLRLPLVETIKYGTKYFMDKYHWDSSRNLCNKCKKYEFVDDDPFSENLL